MRFEITAVLIMLLAIGGCTTEAQRRDAEVDAWKRTLPAPNADYGTYPTNYVELIKANFGVTLKDPESARYGTFSKPRKEHIITSIHTKEAIYGYSVCAPVNAKNSYGGYTGTHRYWFFIRNGKILRSQDIDSGGLNANIYVGRPVNCEDG